MKKVIFSFGIFLFVSVTTSAQAYDGKTEYNKKKQDAFIVEFRYSPEAVENAIIQKMEKMGYKGKEEKGIFNKDRGFRIYKNAFITEISNDKMDYIINIEKKSRKETDESVLYLIIMKDDQNVISGFDAASRKSARAFLNNLLPDVEAADLELQIDGQQAIATKAEKKLQGLKQDKTDLEKKLQDNQKNQEDTQKDIENQNQLLENLKLKRKTN